MVGAHMMCSRATDMIGELSTAIANKLTDKDLSKAMKAHPTYNEALAEAGKMLFRRVYIVEQRKNKYIIQS